VILLSAFLSMDELAQRTWKVRMILIQGSCAFCGKDVPEQWRTLKIHNHFAVARVARASSCVGSSRTQYLDTRRTQQRCVYEDVSFSAFENCARLSDMDENVLSLTLCSLE